MSALQPRGREGPLVEMLVLRAEAAARFSVEEDAARVLDEAFRIAQRAGHFRKVVEAGPWLPDFLRSRLKAGASGDPPLRRHVKGPLAAF